MGTEIIPPSENPERASIARRQTDIQPSSIGERQTKLGHLLNSLATRRVTWLSMLLLSLSCVFTWLFMENAIRSLERNHKIFNDRQLRNGFQSMSDVQRVLQDVQSAIKQGGFTPEIAEEFSTAVDILYVRKENFRRVLEAGEPLESAGSAIEGLERMVTIADAHIAAGLEDPEAIWEDLDGAADDTRRALVRFLDDMDRMQADVLVEQRRIVDKQKKVVLVTLGGLAVFCVSALLLLRREVIARNARDRAERHVQYLAYFDPLTRLPNRSQFQERVTASLDAGKSMALMLVDLDDFKAINDTYGHAAGDAVLRHTANILQAVANKHKGFATRLGGDEFAIVLPTPSLNVLTGISERIMKQTKQPLVIENESIRISVSIGIATSFQIARDEADRLTALTRIADFALYASKTNGRGRYTIYNNNLEKRFLERKAMIDDLPKATENEDIELYLQPKVTLPDCRPFAFEALARWRRDGKIVSPAEFISVAEESGSIFEIDRYMLRNSTLGVGKFNAENNSQYAVSVNLSALHFASDRIVTWVSEALRESTLDPELLTLEITETVELQDMRQASDVVERVRDLGVRVSIDDFGTGFASLAYLRRTIADEIKIDRAMVEGVDTSDSAHYLLDGVLTMARNLNIDVVVEGIETHSQLDAIMKMGAQSAQGYLFGMPMPMDRALLTSVQMRSARTG